MKLQLLLMACGVMSLNAAQLHSQQRVTVSLDDVSIVDVIKEVERQSGQTVTYNNTALRGLRKVSVEMADAAAIDVLNRALRGTGLDVKTVDENLVIFQSQQQTEQYVHGVVQDEDGKPLPGATVLISGTTRAVATDAQGRFRLALRGANPKIEVSFLGMKDKIVTVNDPSVSVTITLENDNARIDNVIVTGVLDLPADFTGAITKITQKELLENWSRDPLRTIALLDPSIRIAEDNNRGSDPNRMPIPVIRGPSTMLSIDDLQAYNIVSDELTAVKYTEEMQDLNSPLFIMDGFEITLERFMDLNPNEIKDVTILKEAGATSLYGSRGANGVIVITSIEPEAGKISITYRGSLDLEIADLSTYDLLSAREKLELERNYGVWDNNVELYEETLAQVEAGRVYDWLKAPLRTGVGQTHSIGMTGGTPEWRYRMNVSNTNTRGAMKGADRNNFNGTLGISYQKKNFNFQQSLMVGVNTYSHSQYGDYSDYVNMNPYYYPWDEDGLPILRYEMVSKPNYYMDNPMYDALVGNLRNGKYTDIRSTTDMRVMLLPVLSAFVNVGINRKISSTNTTYKPSDSRFGGTIDQRGQVRLHNQENNGWEVGVGLNYGQTFNQKHVVSAGFTTQMSEEVSDYVDWVAQGLFNDELIHPGLALAYPEVGGPTGYRLPTRLLSFVGRASYSYAERYFLDASFTRDGTSSYGPESRYGGFYSMGAAWDIGRENFIKNNFGFVDEFRVSYSYGVSGNMGFRIQDLIQSYQMDMSAPYTGNEYGWSLENQENPNLEWQSTFTNNLGVNLDILDDRISFRYNYYTKLTKNTINTVYIPISHGFASMVTNIGTIRNTGHEYYLTLNLIRKPDEQFYLSTNIRLAHNKNTIVKVSEAFKEMLQSTFVLDSSRELMRYREGHSMSAIYGLRTLGIDPASGERWYVGEDGRVTLQQRPQDLVYLGDTEPKVNGSVMVSLSYKGFRLTTGVQFRYGGMTENRTEIRVENLAIASNIDRRALKDVWQAPGDRARYQNRLTNEYTTANDMFINRENTISCANINLEYQLPSRFVNNIGLEYISLGVDYSDVFYLSTVKRERGISFPFTRNPNFKITCMF